MIRRQITHRSRNRRAIQETQPARPGDITPVFALGDPTTTLLLTSDFTLVAQAAGDVAFAIPDVVTADAVELLIIGIEVLTPTTALITCSAVLNDPVVVTIPDQWPYLRTTKGGYLTPGVYNVTGVP